MMCELTKTGEEDPERNRPAIPRADTGLGIFHFLLTKLQRLPNTGNIEESPYKGILLVVE